MFGLGFMGFLVAIFNFVGLFNYDRMIGILFMIFLAAILDFRNQIANFRDEKSPLSFITLFITLLLLRCWPNIKQYWIDVSCLLELQLVF